MTKIEAVRNMQLYIEKHIDCKISLADLSRVSYYSPWHSYRIFKEVLEMSPSEYIRKLKLSLSAISLRDFDLKIVEVSERFGYDSVDGFQRAFFKEFGLNPHEYAKLQKPISLFTPYLKYDQKGEIKMEKTNHVFVSLVEKQARKVIIKRGIKAKHYMDYCDEVGCDVWGILKSIKSSYKEPVSMWLPSRLIEKDTSSYVQGIEVDLDYNGEIPEGFDVITLDKATYLMFTGEPFMEENYVEAITELQNAIKNYNPNVLGYEWNKREPHIQLEPIGERGYIELKAVNKL